MQVLVNKKENNIKLMVERTDDTIIEDIENGNLRQVIDEAIRTDLKAMTLINENGGSINHLSIEASVCEVNEVGKEVPEMKGLAYIVDVTIHSKNESRFMKSLAMNYGTPDGIADLGNLSHQEIEKIISLAKKCGVDESFKIIQDIITAYEIRENKPFYDIDDYDGPMASAADVADIINEVTELFMQSIKLPSPVNDATNLFELKAKEAFDEYHNKIKTKITRYQESSNKEEDYCTEEGFRFFIFHGLDSLFTFAKKTTANGALVALGKDIVLTVHKNDMNLAFCNALHEYSVSSTADISLKAQIMEKGRPLGDLEMIRRIDRTN